MSRQTFTDFTTDVVGGLVVGQAADTTVADAISCSAGGPLSTDLASATGTSVKKFIAGFTRSSISGSVTVSAGGVLLATLTPMAGAGRDCIIECTLWYDTVTSRVKALTQLLDVTSAIAEVSGVLYECTAPQTVTLTTLQFTFDVALSTMDNTAATKGACAYSV